MSREIKFRGKSVDGQLVYGIPIKTHIGTYMITEENPHVCSVYRYMEIDEFIKVDENTVGQFTGLHDKNGKEIYEGDIVECVSWNEYFSKDGQPMEVFRRKMYIDFRNGGFKMIEPMTTPLEDLVWDIIYNGDIEVIGNIHDNPELLEER